MCFLSVLYWQMRERDRQTDRQTDVLNNFEQTDVDFDARVKASVQKRYSSVNSNAMMWICVPKTRLFKTYYFICMRKFAITSAV